MFESWLTYFKNLKSYEPRYPDADFFFKIRENTDNFHTDNIYQNYHTDKRILIKFRKVNFTDKTQTDKIWKIDDHTDKTINFWITKLLIKKKPMPEKKK